MATVAQFSSSMMENHIPAAVLDAAKGFSAVVGKDGSQFVFSIGSDGIFRISADANTGCSPWTTQDAAASLLKQIGSGSVSCFAVGYNAIGDTITIAIVISGIASSGNQLFVADALPASATAGWISSGTIAWTAVPFDSTAYSTITSATLNVSAITLMLTEQNASGETPLAFVTAIDPSNANYRVFSVVIPPGPVQPGKTAWNNFILPTDSDDMLAIAAGQPFPTVGQGLYVLGTSTAGAPVLDFVPYLYDGTAVLSYSNPGVPAGASAIAALVLPDQTQQTGNTVSELYVAGTNSLTICPAGRSVTNIEVISGSSYIVGTTQLHVQTNYGDPNVADDEAIVTVWGVNKPTPTRSTRRASRPPPGRRWSSCCPKRRRSRRS